MNPHGFATSISPILVAECSNPGLGNPAEIPQLLIKL